jgi:hypothetical protein
LVPESKAVRSLDACSGSNTESMDVLRSELRNDGLERPEEYLDPSLLKYSK